MLNNYLKLEHIATGYPITVALNSKECQLLDWAYDSDSLTTVIDCVENRMQLNGDLQEDETIRENYFVEDVVFKDSQGKIQSLGSQ